MSLAFIVVAAAALVAGKLPLTVLVLLVAIAAAGQLFRVVRARGVHAAPLAGFASIIGFIVVAAVKGDNAPSMFPLVIAGALALCFVAMIARRGRQGVTNGVAQTMLVVLAVGLLGAYIIALRGSPNGFRVVLAFAIFAAGSELGPRLLTSARARRGVSLDDRLVGFGGAIFGALITWPSVALLLSPPFDWGSAFVLALLVAIAAATGDLVWAMIERDVAMANPRARAVRASILRGLDGVLLAAPVFFYGFRILAA